MGAMSTCPNFHVTVGHAGDCGRGLAASSFSHGCWRVDKPWPGARPGLPVLQTLEDEAGKMSRAAQKTSPAKELQLSTRPKKRAAGLQGCRAREPKPCISSPAPEALPQLLPEGRDEPFCRASISNTGSSSPHLPFIFPDIQGHS